MKLKKNIIAIIPALDKNRYSNYVLNYKKNIKKKDLLDFLNCNVYH